MYRLLSESSGNVVGFKIGESITTEDMHEMNRVMAEAIAASGKIRLLVEIEGFRYMDPEALLEKLKFVMDHPRDIERMAVVSTRVWIKSWIKIGRLFSPTQVEYFDRSEYESAWKWLHSRD